MFAGPGVGPNHHERSFKEDSRRNVAINFQQLNMQHDQNRSIKDVRAQKFPRTDFLKLWLQLENDKIRLKT